jgi:hypothetical protein
MNTVTANKKPSRGGMQTCDRQIRVALRERLDVTHKTDPDTLVLEELGLCKGASRVDIAVINGSIHGYEIKSERDTLNRLPSQQETYSKILDKVTIVIGEQHLQKVYKAVPSWWGIEVVSVDEGVMHFNPVRDPDFNQNIDPFAVVQLLWREEALEVLKNLGLARGINTKPRAAIWSKLVANMSPEEICSTVRERLKSRGDWRACGNDLTINKS